MFDSEMVFEDDVELLEKLTQRGLEDWLAEDGFSGLPPELADQSPGLILGVMLSSVDVHVLTGPERVAVLQARQRMLSHLQGQLYADMTAVADAVIETLGEDAEADPVFAEQAAASELRAALHLTRKAADEELALARSLQMRLPEVWEAMMSGTIDRRHGRHCSRLAE